MVFFLFLIVRVRVSSIISKGCCTCCREVPSPYSGVDRARDRCTDAATLEAAGPGERGGLGVECPVACVANVFSWGKPPSVFHAESHAGHIDR